MVKMVSDDETMPEDGLTQRLMELRDQFIIDVPETNRPDRPFCGTFIRCEFLTCSMPVQTALPDKWTQSGESRFPDAESSLASWCPKHSTEDAYAVHGELLKSVCGKGRLCR